MRLLPLTPELLAARSRELAALVRDAVEGGASIGFTLRIQTSSGGAFHGSSSAPPSCEMCQRFASRE